MLHGGCLVLPVHVLIHILVHPILTARSTVINTMMTTISIDRNSGGIQRLWMGTTMAIEGRA